MIFEDFGTAGGADATGGEDVFDGDGNSGRGRERFVDAMRAVDFVGLGVGAFGGESEIGV